MTAMAVKTQTGRLVKRNVLTCQQYVWDLIQKEIMDMPNGKQSYTARLIFAVLVLLATATVNASVRYVFTVDEQPTEGFHKPFRAELVLSDNALSAGLAEGADIESLEVTAGLSAMDDDALTLAQMHTSFVNWSVTLSEDRRTITAISAAIAPHMSTVDYWLLYQPNPPHPDLDVHENLAYVAADSITIDTTILPVPPSYRQSVFRGGWQRGFVCIPCRVFEQWVECFPFCIWPWLLILVVIVLPPAIWLVRRRSQNR
jgi:hypothetical protein